MKLNDIPKLMPVPFGVNGPREEIRDESLAGQPFASYSDGFPPITMLMKQAGGLPPQGKDMNQILFELASGQRWSNSGAGYKFNEAFSESVGGYPKGAHLLSNDGTKVYVSTKDDNKTDFNTSPGDDWVTLGNYIGLGDYAKAEDLKKYLAKDQNGADIQNKDTFIKNLGLPELLDKKFDKTGGVITASGAAVDIRTKSDSSGYFQISDTSGKAMHQIGKTTAGAELIIRNVTEEATVSIGKQGVKFNGSLLGIINTAFNGNNGGGWWRCGTTGVIIQWGRTPSGATSRPINFPIPFTDAGYVVNHFDGGFRDNTRWGTSDRTKTGFIAMCNDASQGGNYIAIGF